MKKKVFAELLTLSIPDQDYDRSTSEFVDIRRGPLVILRDKRLIVSAEDGGYFADYYGSDAQPWPWVHPALEKLAEKHGGFWEWENPGCIYFCE